MPHGDEQRIDEVARRLRDAQANGRTVAPVRDDLADGGLDAAYAVARINTEHAIEAGHVVVGHKIGLTSEAVQRQLGVDQPDVGTLFADMAVADGGTLDHDAVLQPRAEAEVALLLGEAIEDPAATVDDLAAAVDHVLPAIEICGSRIAGWDISILDTIADNASSGRYVLGVTPVDPRTIDLAACTMTMTRDGETVSQGSGAACLGHPYVAALWLAHRMIALGTPLQAGELVLSGALGPMVDLAPGARVEATIVGLGTVAVGRAAAPAARANATVEVHA